MNHQFIFNLSILHMFEILDVLDSYHHLNNTFSAITKFGFMDFGISHHFCRQLGATFDLLLKTEALLGADCRPRMLPLLAMALVLGAKFQRILDDEMSATRDPMIHLIYFMSKISYSWR